MDNHNYAPHNSSLGDINANLMAALMYAGVFLFALIPFVGFLAWAFPLIIIFVEKNSEYVKFHAAQSLIIQLLFCLAGVILAFMGFVFQIPTNVINSLINGAAINPIVIFDMLLDLASLIVYGYLAYKAYKYEAYKVPIVGEYAETMVNKVS